MLCNLLANSGDGCVACPNATGDEKFCVFLAGDIEEVLMVPNLILKTCKPIRKKTMLSTLSVARFRFCVTVLHWGFSGSRTGGLSVSTASDSTRPLGKHWDRIGHSDRHQTPDGLDKYCCYPCIWYR